MTPDAAIKAAQEPPAAQAPPAAVRVFLLQACAAADNGRTGIAVRTAQSFHCVHADDDGYVTSFGKISESMMCPWRTTVS